MARKEFIYRGKTLEELQAMSLNELAEQLPSRARRCIKKGFNEQQKIFLHNLRKGSKNLKTHCRDLVVLPEMVSRQIKIHNGREFVIVDIQPEMIGHYLGEFALTRKKVNHSAPGIGATRSSANISVK
ncbi:30S ribosomal protein S19 [Candidatus Woesearchaeota archaeon]|nr:30S ribosomal protein S19 [Candidatus Woesearchaeota archaeon]